MTGNSQCPFKEIEINAEAAKAHRDHHGDANMSCDMMCRKLSKNVFDPDTCRCVDPEPEDPPAPVDDSVGCMPEIFGV